MKKFVVLYYAPVAAMAQMANVSKENHEKAMQAWFQWKENHDANIVNLGAPLMPGQSLDATKKWSSSSKDVTGFSLVQGEDIESVKAIFKDHPHLSWAEGCEIDVHEHASM